MASLSVQNLIEHFQSKLQHSGRFHVEKSTGEEPHYPMIVVYLGRPAARAHACLQRSLLQVWPQYDGELFFIGAEPAGDGKARFFEMQQTPSAGAGEAAACDVDESRIFEIVTRLHGASTHFRDRRRLLVYYVLDTTGLAGADGLIPWMETIRVTRGELMNEQMSMLTVLLNDDFRHQSAAKDIRNRLSELQRAGSLDVGSVFLLSNKRDDSAILEHWEPCYHILADLIMLSNSTRSDAALPMFASGVKAVRYARQEKPSAEIGQVVVRCVVSELDSHKGTGAQANPFADEGLPERLGITPQGTLHILDEYAAHTLIPSLPTPEQLECFPRRTDEDCGELHALSAHEFDELTMGAWGCYLGSVVREAEEKVKKDATLRARWQEQYSELLARNFSAEELIYLSAHRRELAELYRNVREPQQGGAVLRVAGARLDYILSTNQGLVDIFLEAVCRQGEAAQEVTATWTELLASMNAVFTVRDENLEAFYTRKVREYFDHNGADKAAQLRRLRSGGELEALLKGIIEEVIDSDPIFYAPFEEELEQRLHGDSNPLNAKSYIREKLTSDEAHLYLTVHSSLGQAFLSCMMLKYGTPLYKSLLGKLDSTTHYYDTGCSDRAEAVVLYDVSPDALIVG